MTAPSLLLQLAPLATRVWPPTAVHDTVQRVLRDPIYRRSLRQSILDRLLIWASDHLSALFKALRGIPSARTIIVAIVIAIGLLLIMRVLLDAFARDGTRGRFALERHRVPSQDPWQVVDALQRDGHCEAAAHALYHAVLAALADGERIRLDAAKTSGDYMRELRRRNSPRGPDFRAFVRAYDAAVYGHRRCDSARLMKLRALGTPFEPRARAA